MYLEKKINLINEILKDIIWDIYDKLYKDFNIIIKINKGIKLKNNILKIKLCLEKICRSGFYINNNLNILINDIINNIKINFYNFKKEILQILDIEELIDHNILNYDKIICFDTFLF